MLSFSFSLSSTITYKSSFWLEINVCLSYFPTTIWVFYNKHHFHHVSPHLCSFFKGLINVSTWHHIVKVPEYSSSCSGLRPAVSVYQLFLFTWPWGGPSPRSSVQQRSQCPKEVCVQWTEAVTWQVLEVVLELLPYFVFEDGSGNKKLDKESLRLLCLSL